MDHAAEFEALYRSWRPLAAASKVGPYYRHRRDVALSMPYIEANPSVLQSLVVIDRDVTDTDLAADLAGLPLPTWAALNPHTGTGHLVYGLRTPVVLTDAARRPPINLLARIEQGLTTALEGDAAYSGRITKNPLVAPHTTVWTGDLFDLRELAAALAEIRALPAAGNARRNVTGSSIGRNVALFDITRAWAYRAIRTHWDGPADEWDTACRQWAWHQNETVIANEFSRGPLSFVEVKHLARSVSRWTWRRITREGFQERQRVLGARGGRASNGGKAGGIRSGEVRRARSIERREALI